ncbi:hypothetical protein Hypma_001524 [Hypsizygus marmoreus]|uniref:Uncharacterized protein n=1 Tax=Hypsizygus marmoreus TaxID=39966 RepID=A0A369K963_HYPMA|nr:hypothetical protein Hypma_001524 [Hypsizygus marmoreus]
MTEKAACIRPISPPAAGQPPNLPAEHWNDNEAKMVALPDAMTEAVHATYSLNQSPKDLHSATTNATSMFADGSLYLARISDAMVKAARMPRASVVKPPGVNEKVQFPSKGVWRDV